MRQGVFTPKLKLLWHREKLDEWLNEGDTIPIMVEFDLTNRCNLNCNFCTFRYIKDRSDIPTDVALETLDRLKGLGVKAVNFTGGGEPTLHKNFEKIVRHAVDISLDVGVFTNGLRQLDPDVFYGCRWVRFSIDAGTPETFELIKGVDGFDKTVENIKTYNRHGTTFGTGFVISPDNYGDLEEFADVSEDLDVDYAQYKPIIQNCFDGNQIDGEWWKANVELRLEKIMEQYPQAVINLYKFNDLRSNIERDYDKCYGHIFCPCIGATGDVWVCTHLRGFPEYSFGNLNDENFVDIWFGDKRQEVIKKIDLQNCQQYCRNNEINKVLYQLKHGEGHYNFI